MSLFESVSGHEGFRTNPYKDTEGLWTFAKGRCLETNPLSPAEWKFLLDNHMLTVSISVVGADWLMTKQLEATELECARVFDFWPDLDEMRREALIEMAYQMGMDRLRGFKKMLIAIRAKVWTEAESEALDSLWAKQTPVRAKAVAKQLATGAR